MTLDSLSYNKEKRNSHVICLLKHLIDKLSEGIRGSQNKLKALQLLLHVVCKQPTWIHNITQSVFGALVKCLKVRFKQGTYPISVGYLHVFEAFVCQCLEFLSVYVGEIN